MPMTAAVERDEGEGELAVEFDGVVTLESDMAVSEVGMVSIWRLEGERMVTVWRLKGVRMVLVELDLGG